MRTRSLPALLVLLCQLFITTVVAQQNSFYSLNDLSDKYYSGLKDSIKKSWICPVYFKEKETQKQFKEYWDQRSSLISTSIEGRNFIHDQEIQEYIGGIIDQLYKGNKQLITSKPTILLDRSSSVNAYAAGGNFIAVNLGLIAFVQSREELALALAHELSHNLLDHSENSMRERAALVTSDEYKQRLKSVLDSEYGRYSRLKQVLEGYTFSRNRHNRYHETDADSLAIQMLKKSGIGFNADFFKRLDSADNEYRQPLKQPLRQYFSLYKLPYDDAWTMKRTKGLSTRNYNFKDTAVLADSVKTHPDCIERYDHNRSLSVSFNAMPVPASIKAKVNKMMIWNLFDGLNLTACLYRIFLEKDAGNTDPWYDLMVYNIFSGLHYSDNELNRFNAIRVMSKEYISTNYYQLQTLLEQIPREQLEMAGKAASEAVSWSQQTTDAKALRGLWSALLQTPANAKAREQAAKDFKSSYANSPYVEFAEHFIK